MTQLDWIEELDALDSWLDTCVGKDNYYWAKDCIVFLNPKYQTLYLLYKS